MEFREEIRTGWLSGTLSAGLAAVVVARIIVTLVIRSDRSDGPPQMNWITAAIALNCVAYTVSAGANGALIWVMCASPLSRRYSWPFCAAIGLFSPTPAPPRGTHRKPDRSPVLAPPL